MGCSIHDQFMLHKENSKEKDKEKSQEISEISEIAFLASRPNLSMDNYNRTILLEAVNDLVHQLQRHKRQKRIVYNPVRERYYNTECK
ncbi:hypothetical protein RclHR1_02770012 [Rhizophagus clarus]|uniref:Uncharacterized protein n=1 Tax=Rhizophagus clarus TaxID=94130 RepID=A0A2Z6R2Z5_9GLOM|nr:hypothetical protein RclHR1_02770012 [Rhizophagus clarus]